LKPKKTRHQERKEKTKNNLLMAARSLFAEKGFDLTTIDEITQRANTGKGTFYYHFRTKEKLINSLIKSVLGELEETINGHCDNVDRLEEILEQVLNAHISFFSNRWEDFVLYFHGRADLILDKGYEGINTPFIHYTDAISSQINRVIAIELSKRDRRRVANAIAGFISGYYSFSSISSTEDGDIAEIFQPVRGALISSLVRFVKSVNNN
jgi:AcrR family transcriptional regulator